MFIYLIAILAVVAVLGFAYIYGQSEYETLNQADEIAPWIVLVSYVLAILLLAVSSYSLYTQMSAGIPRQTFLLAFLFILALMMVAYVALYLFAQPLSAQYISLIAATVIIWYSIFAGAVSYGAAGVGFLSILAVGLLFVVATRLNSAN